MLTPEQVGDQVKILTGVSDASFKTFLKNATDEQLEEARTQYKIQGREENQSDNRQIGRALDRRAYRCKLELVRRREESEQPA